MSRSQNIRSAVKVGSLFAAIGGFAHAFKLEGASPVWANEVDRFAAMTFEHNLPNVRMLRKNVEMLHVFDDALEPVDVLTAGFPCQPFSVAGEKRGLQDERGILFLQIVRIIREFGAKRPKILLLENVKHLAAHDGGRTFARIQAEVQKAGYWFGPANAKILNTLDYSDIPQNRERLFMIALSHEYFKSGRFQFPEPNRPRRLRPVSEFLDLDRRQGDYFYFTPTSQYYPLFDAAMRSGGDGIYQLRRNYVRKNMTDTCFTLMANMGDGGHNQPVIKDRWGIRKLTPTECARLQGYDDAWFKFPEALSLNQGYKQVGNSVTVPVVRSLASQIISSLRFAGTASDEVA
jgi:DNA (cytosine-5)-methyltransferase 1